MHCASLGYARHNQHGDPRLFTVGLEASGEGKWVDVYANDVLQCGPLCNCCMISCFGTWFYQVLDYVYLCSINYSYTYTNSTHILLLLLLLYTLFKS